MAVTENEPVVEKSDIVFISVKPGVVPIALEDIKHKAAGKLFISVAMGVTIRDIEKVYLFVNDFTAPKIIIKCFRFYQTKPELFG